MKKPFRIICILIIVFLNFAKAEKIEIKKYYHGKITCKTVESKQGNGFNDLICESEKKLNQDFFRVFTYFHIAVVCQEFQYFEMIEQLNSDHKVSRTIRCLKSDSNKDGSKNESAENIQKFMNNICGSENNPETGKNDFTSDKEAKKMCKKINK